MQKQKSASGGFALLIAVIFTSVVLALSLALSSIGYKQQVLASVSVGSQHAFYAADAALECALYADQGQNQNIFAYNADLNALTPNMVCDGVAPYSSRTVSHTSSLWVIFNRLSLGANRCADVTIYKYAVPQSGVATRIFSQGYDTACDTIANPPANARFVSRGIDIRY
ncbi:MAG: hypothetical protein WC798_00870 [Candidatus Paceibacterota bacterium]